MGKRCNLKSVSSKGVKENVELQLVKAGIPRPLVGAISGYLVDNYVLDTDGDPDKNTIGLMTLIGAGLGTKTMRPVIQNTVKGFTNLSKSFGKAIELEGKKKAANELLIFGGKVNLDDAAEIAEHSTLFNAVKNVANTAVDNMSKIFNNKFAQSTQSLMRKFGGTSGKRFNNIMETLNTTINSLVAAPRAKFATMMGGDANAYVKFNTTEAPKLIGNIVKSLLPDSELPELRLKQLWDESFKRIIDSAPVNEDGVWRLSEVSPGAKRMYDDANWGDYYKAIDEQLLKDETVGKFIQSNQDFFSDVMGRWTGAIDGKIVDEMDVLKLAVKGEKRLERGYDVLSEFIISEASFKDFLETLKPAELKALNSLFKNSAQAQNIRDLKKIAAKFTNLDKKYYPQIISTEKITTDFKRFVDKNSLGGMTKAEATEAYRKDLTDRVIKMNAGEKKLEHYDPDAGEIKTMVKDSRAKALKYISDVIDELRKQGRVDEAENLAKRQDEFLIAKSKPTDKLKKDGTPRTKTIYEIQTPDDFGSDPFDYLKKFNYRRFIDDMLSGAIVRQSNFLENPRLKHLPYEILETNIEQVVQRYSVDVGRRLHFAENKLFSNDEVEGFLNALGKEAKELNNLDDDAVKYIVDRATSSFNYVNGLYGKTGNDIQRQIKAQKVSDVVRNAFFMRFGYGFGFYNMFEFGVVSPHISSYSSVRQTLQNYLHNKEALSNATETLKMLNLVRHQIGAIRPEYENFSVAGNQFNTLESAQALSGKGANFVSDFSATKSLMRFFKGDPSDLGLGELAFGSYTSSNAVATTINASAALAESNKLAQIAKRLLDGEQIVREGGEVFNLGSVKRKLENLGITEDRFDIFIKNSDDFSKGVEEFTSSGKIDMEKMGSMSNYSVDELNEDYYYDMVNILRQATETFHGTNKIYRPETWNTPVGRMMSMYASYPFNFAMQHVQKRIKQPIDEWFKINAEGKNKILSLEVFEIFNKFRSGDIEGLKKMGLSEEAINTFPIEAYQNILKHVGTFGLSIAGYATLDTIKDALEYPFVEDKDEWKRLKRYTVINPYAPEKEQVSWGDIDEEFGLDTFGHIVTYFSGFAARSSLFGSYGNIIENKRRLSQDGIMALTPMTQLANDILKGFSGIANNDLSDIPVKAFQQGVESSINWMPFLGSSILSGPRKAILNQVNRKNKGDFIKFKDEETGEIIDSDEITYNSLY